MTYYKFLRPGRISPFESFAWPAPGTGEPGDWVGVDEAPSPCRSGIHACRVGDLPYWLNEELWQIEFDGDVVESDLKVVGSRARLVARVTAWDQAMDGTLATACAVRAAGHAADELRTELPAHGERLAAAAEASARAIEGYHGLAGELLGPVEEATREGLEESARLGHTRAATLCGYVVDCIDSLGEYPAASITYIAARVADGRSVAESDDPFAEERRWQANWLATHLGLDGY